MNRKLVVTIVVALLVTGLSIVGCMRGDLKATMVIAGQPAPHDGYNIGEDIYVEEGKPVIMTGAVVWIKGLDPNDLTD